MIVSFELFILVLLTSVMLEAGSGLLAGIVGLSVLWLLIVLSGPNDFEGYLWPFRIVAAALICLFYFDK